MKIAIIFSTILIFASLDTRQTDLTIDPDLWVDATQQYLSETAEWTNRVEVADLNGDKLLDIVFANGGDYSEPGALESSRVFINQGPNTKFKETTSLIFVDQKFYARVIKAVDVNLDKIPDLIIGTTFQTQTQLYLGLGEGRFKNVTASHLPQVKASIGDLELGDVDDDGDLDIVLTDWGAGSNMENGGGLTMLWVNDGQGKFQDVTGAQMPDLLIQFSWDLEFIDVDNDFDLDIAISCKRCGTSRLFVNDGHGKFTNKFAFPAYTNNYEFEPMDLNSDGFIDLVTVNDGEIVNKNIGSRREHIFLNDSGKYFIDATEESWPNSANIGEDDNNVVFLDFDSDGDPDFLLSSLTGDDRLLINDGKGKFSLAQPILKGPPTPHTLSMVLGDINNDKKLDIIMGQGEGEEVISEMIFIGDKLNPDTAPPAIALTKIKRGDDAKTVVVKARIHDRKSPSMPQDWSAVEFKASSKSKPFAMQWYGEYLWKVELQNASAIKDGQICATDYCGNKKCIVINE
jgi:hypothetical protein